MMETAALDWSKGDGLLPAVVQDADTGRVLMLAYMNSQALEQTLGTGKVTFWSRSRRRLWTKGETSGNTLALVSVEADCDGDALLVQARPAGPTCHLGRTSCFAGAPAAFTPELQRVIAQRAQDGKEGSYTRQLMDAGQARIAQKVGEEGVEVALAAVASGDLIEESADLIYHLLVLLQSSGCHWDEVEAELRRRHAQR